MKKIIKWVVSGVVLVLVLVTVCLYIYGPNVNIYIIPPTAQKYGDFALNKMDQLGLYTNSTEWSTIKKETQEKLKSCKNYDETIPILRKAIEVAGGKHSSIENGNELNNAKKNEQLFPTKKNSDNILTLTIPPFSGNEEQAEKYANTLNEGLTNYKYEGIILDFRDNTGGDLGPMISGLSPLLSDGKLLDFVDKDGNKESIELENGSVVNAGTTVKIETSKKITNVPIAILINEHTGSSGEITALCFKGLKNVKFIGSESAGYTSSNMQINLYDGSIMQITHAAVEDKEHIVYNNTPVIPDIKSSSPIQVAKTYIEDYQKKIDSN